MEAIAIEENTLPINENSMLLSKEYRPSDNDILRQYEITLKYLSKGMIITIGCKQIAFSDNKEGLDALNAYINNPNDESDKWHKILNN
jgi:hypothetical protein